MSFQITTAFKKQFRDTFMHLVQQSESRLSGAVINNIDVEGEETYVDQIGTIEPEQLGGRHADTPMHDIDHKRRKLVVDWFVSNLLVDKPDRIKAMADPTSKYNEAIRRGFARQKDRVIITAFDADVDTGKEGTGTASFDSDMSIAVDYVDGSNTNTNLTLDKLRRANRLLDENEVPDEGRHLATTAAQIEGLLGQEKLTSSDYAAVKALLNGDISAFMGFEFHKTQLLPKSGDVRDNFFWQEDGIELGMAEQPMARITERPDKNYSKQVYRRAAFGAVRLEEERVGRIKCDETQ